MDVIAPYHDTCLEKYGLVRFINFIENTMKRDYFGTVLYPSPSHHQDHRTTQKACMAALRPGAQDYTPHCILMYEYTYPTWANVTTPDGKLYVDITKTIGIKEQAVRAYKSQLRENNHPVSIDAMRTMAKSRGFDIGVRYAEMFQVVRIITEIE
jgi:LmbE family N-acetylglucosaminyl deacetylase